LYANSDSEFRAEILGEQGGKAIAIDHSDYQPEKVKSVCKDLYLERWKEHFRESFFTDITISI
jgi:hypothetical protein